MASSFPSKKMEVDEFHKGRRAPVWLLISPWEGGSKGRKVMSSSCTFGRVVAQNAFIQSHAFEPRSKVPARGRVKLEPLEPSIS